MLTITTTGATMTSREIADICEARHNDVIATIERLIDKEVLRLGRNTARAHTPEGGGRPTMVYDLDKRDCLVVVSGYNDVLRARIIDRWIELESAAPAPVELSRMELIQIAMQAETERLALAQKIEADAPKVAFAEIIRAMDGVCRIGDFCKTMKAGRNKLFARMKADKILMENRMPYQKYIDKGYFSVIEQKPYTDSKGAQHPAFTTMVTGAGQLFLTRKYHDLTGAA